MIFVLNKFIHFCQAGPLENVRIPKDRDTGKQRTFGFVVYQEKCSVPYACELFDTLKLFGRPIGCKPQNNGSNSPKETPAISFSDDDSSNYQRNEEAVRTPKLDFFGVDNSPYGRTPDSNFAGNRRLQLHRSYSGGMPSPLLDLRTQALMSQSSLQWTEQNFPHDSPGPMRRSQGTYRAGSRRLGQPY